MNLEEIMEKIKKYIDFSFKKTDLIGLYSVIFCFVFVEIFNITEIWENTFLENLQLIPLILGAILCFKAKKHKPFYIVIAMLLVLFFMRELSYGRVLFAAIPDNPHDFYPWSHYKWGYLANIIIGLYLVSIFIFGIIKKIWNDIIAIINKVKFPFLSFLTTLIFIAFEITGEKIHNTVLEEISELAIYCLTLSICIIYLKITNKE